MSTFFSSEQIPPLSSTNGRKGTSAQTHPANCRSHIHDQKLYNNAINTEDNDNVDKIPGIMERFQVIQAIPQDRDDPCQREQGVVKLHIQSRRNETSISVNYQEHSKENFFLRKVKTKDADRGLGGEISIENSIENTKIKINLELPVLQLLFYFQN